jgi:hypothetical protein
MTAWIGQLEHDNRNKATVADSRDSTLRTERLGHDSNDRTAASGELWTMLLARSAGTG